MFKELKDPKNKEKAQVVLLEMYKLLTEGQVITDELVEKYQNIVRDLNKEIPEEFQLELKDPFKTETSEEEKKEDTPPVEEERPEIPKTEESPQDTPPVEEEPKADVPETDEPQVDAPEVKEPEVKEPEVKEPEVKEPEVKEPEVKEPEVKKPQADAPKVDAPKAPESNEKAPKVESDTKKSISMTNTSPNASMVTAPKAELNLPQTGEKTSPFFTAAAMAIMASVAALAIPSKRKNK